MLLPLKLRFTQKPIERISVIFYQAYDETGEVFPIWGECLGFELIAMLVSGRDLSLGQYDQSFLSITDARNISLKLDLPAGKKAIDFHTTGINSLREVVS